MKKIAFLLSFLPVFLYAQIPAGSVGKYQLNNTANDVSGNGNNGTLTATTGAPNRFATANAATQFTSGSSSGTIPVIVTDNFSVGFWFKSTMTASTSTQWYGGNSLIDAEVCGQTNDWGTALINGGQIAFGVGNPDMTIISPLSYNDGNWHFITATRDESGSGTMILYVDGAQVASTTGINTGTLNAPSILGLARNNCTGADYTGLLDDAIFYTRVLSGAEVTSLFTTLSASPLPLHWLSFSGQASGSRVTLQWEIADPGQNDHFEVEHSTDAENFLTIGVIPEKNNLTAAMGSLLFSYVDGNPTEGVNYYRIKQVDIDGSSTWSKLISIDMRKPFEGMNLLSNPVHASLVLRNPGQEMIGDMEVLDPAGRLLRRQSVQSRNSMVTLDAGKLPAGYYLLRVEGNTGEITLPFIRQ